MARGLRLSAAEARQLLGARSSAIADAPGAPRSCPNKTEQRYIDYRLEPARRAGEIRWWLYERIKLRIGHRCWYTVDFVLQAADGVVECHEVKGGWIRDDALVKFRAAQEQYPMLRFVLAQWREGMWREIR